MLAALLIAIGALFIWIGWSSKGPAAWHALTGQTG